MTSLVHLVAKMLAPTHLKMTLSRVKNTALHQEKKKQNAYHLEVTIKNSQGLTYILFMCLRLP